MPCLFIVVNRVRLTITCDMALIPYGPNDFKSLIPSASSSLCEKLLALPGRLATYVYRVVKWAVNDDLTASDDLKNWLSLSTSTSMVAPTGVTASDGTSSSSVVVSWTASAGASYYTIYRSTGSVFSGATTVGTSTTTSYTDSTVVVDTVYTYWVKASSASATSSESTPDTGFAQSSSATSRTFTATGTFTVPAGITSLTGCVVLGKGGDGGDRGAPPWGLPGSYNPGGGGGGGEYAIGTIPVTPLESLDIIITSTGSAIQRSTTVLISAGAGSNGGVGGISGGSGGAGGTGGTFGGTVTSTTRNAGSVGSAGSGSSGGAGGATTPVVSGYGTGGTGSGTASSNATTGLGGKVVLNW